MKILILVITITWSFGYNGEPQRPICHVVSSPRRAAIMVYEDKMKAIGVEPDQKQYDLYEIWISDFKPGDTDPFFSEQLIRAKAVKIPEVKFE